MRHLHAPQHMSQNLEANLQTILRINAETVVLTEQDAGRKDNVARIEAAVGHRYHVCAAPAGSGHEREVVVLVKKRLGRKIWHVEHDVLSENLGDDKGIGNDRHQITVYWHGRLVGDCATIGTHWNAAIQSKKTGGLLNSLFRAKAMVTAAKTLETKLEHLQADGYRVTGSADFNYREHLPKSDDWDYAPQNIFRRLKVRWVSKGLDWVWWKGFKLQAKTVIEPGTQGNGSDHPWILVTLKRLP